MLHRSLIVATTLASLCVVVMPAAAQEAAAQDAGSGMQYPLAVVENADGVIFVADRNLPGIWKIENGKRSIFHQASKQFRTPMNAVRCLALDHEGQLLAGDSATREVYRFDAKGEPTPLTKGWIGIPMSIVVDPDGVIYVADLETHRIWKMPAEGSPQPEEVAAINSPRGLAIDDERRIWVLSTSSSKGQIQRILPDGTIESIIENHPFNLPHNIALDAEGAAFVTDNYEVCVWKVTPGEVPVKWVTGEPLVKPVGLVRAGARFLIADPHAKKVFALSADRTLTPIAAE